MITRLTVRNYRSIACTEIDPGPLTVLVGVNGSGKSNLVDVLRFVRDILVHGLDKAVSDRNGINEIMRWSVENEDISVQFHFNLPDCSGEYGFSLSISPSEEEWVCPTFYTKWVNFSYSGLLFIYLCPTRISDKHPLCLSGQFFPENNT